MNSDVIKNEYFNWLFYLISDNIVSANRCQSHKQLLMFMHSVDFIYSIPMDENRAEDGINLRYRFGREKKYAPQDISRMLDIKPCSVLEMLIALSVRCEENIMYDESMGSRAGKWFWDMLTNLGLEEMTDRRFNKGLVLGKINVFLNREFKPNGEGGLFTVKNSNYDLRREEIWYQLMFHLNEVIKEKGF